MSGNLHTFGRNIAEKPLKITKIMSKVRIPINPLQVGRVGAYSMYVRNSEQIVRQRKNNSNYGESASRSMAQQTRRVKWANLVNMWKVVGSYLKAAFETKPTNQTDYNAFMQINSPSARINLKKEEAENDAVVADGIFVSKGTFPAVTEEALLTSPYIVARLFLTRGIELLQSTTWGAFCTDLIANNPEWQDGDNIALLVLEKYTDPLNGFPHLRPFYFESTIDSTSTAPRSGFDIGDLLNMADTEGSSGVYGIVLPGITAATFGGAAVFHTRRSGKLYVSTESLIYNADDIANYTSAASLAAAIASYGLDPTVVLDPN